jgi:hypothetical protein
MAMAFPPAVSPFILTHVSGKYKKNCRFFPQKQPEANGFGLFSFY